MKVQDRGDTQINRLLAIREASKIIGIGYNTLLGAASSGQLRTVPVGTHRRVSVTALNEFVEELESGRLILRPA